MYKNDNQYSCDNNFVKISLIHELNQIKPQDSKNKPQSKNLSVIIRLCPLDPFMNNVDKMETITWPTIYVTKTLSNALGLKMNSKVVLEPVNRINNEICGVQNIYICPSKQKVCFKYYFYNSI